MDSIIKKIIEVLKDEKFLLVVLVIFAIFVAALTFQSCHSYSNVSSFDSLKVYNFHKDLNLQSK